MILGSKGVGNPGKPPTLRFLTAVAILREEYGTLRRRRSDGSDFGTYRLVMARAPETRTKE